MAVEHRVRFLDADGRLRLGRLFGLADGGAFTPSTVVRPAQGDLLSCLQDTGEPDLAVDAVQLLAPLVPGKVVGIASNYRDHAAEMGRPIPTVVKLFVMPSTAVIGPGDAIVLPPSERVDHEAELGLVIGRTACCVSESESLSAVAGFTVVNDVTARDHQRQDKVFGRAKGYDTFCPLGPALAVGIDPRDLRVWCRVDGELRQDGTTADLVFGLAHIVSFVSHVMTLQPGDVIATGTPAGVGPLLPGQVCEVGVEGVGVLRNPVVARADRT